MSSKAIYNGSRMLPLSLSLSMYILVFFNIHIITGNNCDILFFMICIPRCFWFLVQYLLLAILIFYATREMMTRNLLFSNMQNAFSRCHFSRWDYVHVY